MPRRTGATPLGFVMYAAAIYLNQAMGKDQAFLGKVLWIPPLGWEVGYFVWGWIFDRFAAAKDRPVFMFFLLAVLMIPFGLTGLIASSAGVLALFFCDVASFNYPVFKGPTTL